MKRRYYVVKQDNSKVYSFSDRTKRTEFLNLWNRLEWEAVPAASAIVRARPVIFKG